MTFFNDWALWEKLCFVLGIAIGLTILAGCGKLIYNARQLRKFTALAAEKKDEHHQQEMQRATSRRGRKPDVPFGIRAIESGIEVDGVWISRPNTPVASAPGSPVIPPVQQPTNPKFAQAAEQNATANIPQLIIPESAHGSGGRERSRSNPQTQQPSRPASSENLTIRERSSASDMALRGRPTYQPRQGSHLRYNSVDARKGPTDLDGPNESNKTLRDSGSSSESEPKVALRTPQHLLPTEGPYQNQYSAIPRNRAHDSSHTQASQEHLDSLATHRESHAAETGQLLPRTRGAGAGSDESVTNDYFTSRNVTPLHDPFQTPETTPRHQPNRSSPPNSHSFFESQQVPLLDNGEPTEREYITRPRQTESAHERQQNRDIEDGKKGQPDTLSRKDTSEGSIRKMPYFIEEV